MLDWFYNNSSDYEGAILAKQEARDLAEEQCNGECEHCRFSEQMPLRYFYEEPKYRCTLNDEWN